LIDQLFCLTTDSQSVWQSYKLSKDIHWSCKWRDQSSTFLHCHSVS
jgi:hypothetical protein